MFKATTYLMILCLCAGTPLIADPYSLPQEESQLPKPFESFTGKVVRDKVRIRLQPSLDGPVVKELRRGDLLIVTDQEEDFYAIKPLAGIKGYVYRTYILDGVVEGNKVNVRLEPHLEAPVLAQLNIGERVEGNICEQNSKWLEIPPPANARLYVATDFIEKVGDASYLSRYEERKQEVNTLLNSNYLLSQQELQKSFPEIETKEIIDKYKKVISDYPEFSEQGQQAKEYLAQLEETYLQKKIAYLEERAQAYSNTLKNKNNNTAFEEVVSVRNEEPISYSNPVSDKPGQTYEKWLKDHLSSETSARMGLWIPLEVSFYEHWSQKNPGSIQDFYSEQKQQAVALRGILESYDRPIKNKPGDYLLVNRSNHLPIAYLYSTHVNLQEMVGHEITVEAVLRPNNHFAFPAYYVLSIED